MNIDVKNKYKNILNDNGKSYNIYIYFKMILFFLIILLPALPISLINKYFLIGKYRYTITFLIYFVISIIIMFMFFYLDQKKIIDYLFYKKALNFYVGGEIIDDYIFFRYNFDFILDVTYNSKIDCIQNTKYYLKILDGSSWYKKELSKENYYLLNELKTYKKSLILAIKLEDFLKTDESIIEVIPII